MGVRRGPLPGLGPDAGPHKSGPFAPAPNLPLSWPSVSLCARGSWGTGTQCNRAPGPFERAL